MSISVVIIVKNGASTLSQTLESLKEFDNVIVYDNGSTDTTLEIAYTFTNVQVIDGYFDGFGSTKNRAASYAKYNWILSLDADETLTEAVVSEVKNLQLSTQNVYQLHRINHYKNRVIKHCWGTDKLVRLYNRTSTQFVEKSVHEYIETKNRFIISLTAPFLHFPYQNISQFIHKADVYSTLYAEENRGKKHASPTRALFDGIHSFIKTYFCKKGFLDGYAGLIIAFSHMVTNFFKYMKLYEANKANHI